MYTPVTRSDAPDPAQSLGDYLKQNPDTVLRTDQHPDFDNGSFYFLRWNDDTGSWEMTVYVWNPDLHGFGDGGYEQTDSGPCDPSVAWGELGHLASGEHLGQLVRIEDTPYTAGSVYTGGRDEDVQLTEGMAVPEDLE